MIADTEITGLRHIKFFSMKVRDIDDYDVVRRALNGEEEAFTLIVNRYRSAVMSHITTIVSNSQDAEDICQEAFHKCFKNLDAFNFKYAFSTWLYTIAQNTALDFLRKKKIPVTMTSNTGNETISPDIESTVPSPEENMINDQAIENLVRSIQNLDPKYRKISELRFIHEYPLEEIAKELNMPLNTVKTRISRAKRLLNEIWKS